MKKKNQGFTLVELIIVIVIMGILAAYVTSRFSTLDASARKSVISTLYSSIKSASSGVHGAAVAQNKVADVNTTIKVEGEDVAIIYGYAAPSKDGLLKAIDTTAIGEGKDIDVSVEGEKVTFKHRSAKDGTKCMVEYSYDGQAASVPVVNVDVSNCD